jgi:hypothetical protein
MRSEKQSVLRNSVSLFSRLKMYLGGIPQPLFWHTRALKIKATAPLRGKMAFHSLSSLILL